MKETKVAVQSLVEQINKNLKNYTTSETEIIGDMKELLSVVSHPHEVWNDFLNNSLENLNFQIRFLRCFLMRQWCSPLKNITVNLNKSWSINAMRIF